MMFQVRDVGFAVASARQQNGCHLLSYEMQNGMSDPASHWHRPASSLAGGPADLAWGASNGASKQVDLYPLIEVLQALLRMLNRDDS